MNGNANFKICETYENANEIFNEWNKIKNTVPINNNFKVIFIAHKHNKNIMNFVFEKCTNNKQLIFFENEKEQNKIYFCELIKLNLISFKNKFPFFNLHYYEKILLFNEIVDLKEMMYSTSKSFDNIFNSKTNISNKKRNNETSQIYENESKKLKNHTSLNNDNKVKIKFNSGIHLNENLSQQLNMTTGKMELHYKNNKIGIIENKKLKIKKEDFKTIEITSKKIK